ncbi:hypothetical protein JOE48_003716 [Methylobacterium sp. PvR107]|nr:hypothetical protein [Methylobacterium sp. PvR107]
MSENDVARTNVPATRDEINNMGKPWDAEWLCCPNAQGPFPVATRACITARLSATFRNTVIGQGVGRGHRPASARHAVS